MDEDVTTIHITEVLSSSLIMDLIDEYPNLCEITCSPSVYERTSKNYIDALEQLDIEVNKKYNWGAKSQTNGEEKIVLDLAKKGFNAREISEKLKVSKPVIYDTIKKYKEELNKIKL